MTPYSEPSLSLCNRAVFITFPFGNITSFNNEKTSVLIQPILITILFISASFANFLCYEFQSLYSGIPNNNIFKFFLTDKKTFVDWKFWYLFVLLIFIIFYFFNIKSLQGLYSTTTKFNDCWICNITK